MSENLVERYSGVVFNQNQKPEVGDFIGIDSSWHYQEFFLPSNYRRGTDAKELVYPPLSGFHLLVGLDADTASTATLDWTLEYKVNAWSILAEGTTIGCHADRDKVWFEVLFADPVDINDTTAVARFRIGFRGRDAITGVTGEVVEYARGSVIKDDVTYDVTLVPSVPYPIEIGGEQGFFYLNAAENLATYSVQRGINKLWYSNPNPLVARGDSKLYEDDGITPVQDTGDDVSACFRVLGLTADEGVDFLGNNYRSSVVSFSSKYVAPREDLVVAVPDTEPSDPDEPAEPENKIWLSKPNPSRFAVESLYFDVRYRESTPSYSPTQEAIYAPISDIPQTIDSIILDPITPGMYFNVYYSNDGVAESTDWGWEQKLWNRVPRTYQANYRGTYALPEPVVARFIKIEFTHLQARAYNPGDFAKPLKYKKHPKWVLDYFLALMDAVDATPDTEFAGRVNVVYDAIQLAYDYYVDDLRQAGEYPVEINQSFVPRVIDFLQNRTDRSDQVDPFTLSQINLSLDAFQQHPSVWVNRSLLGEYTRSSYDRSINYPTERQPSFNYPNLIEQRNREVTYENNYPVMFFYVTCRHKYREIVAEFPFGRAYFAGVREIGFLRNHYSSNQDNVLYVEPGGDNVNTARSDFTTIDGQMVV